MPKTIFAIIPGAPANIVEVEQAIKRAYPSDSIKVGNGSYLVADEGTSQTVSDKLGITNAEPALVKSALVVSISGYFGRQPTPVWEWIKSKWGGQ